MARRQGMVVEKTHRDEPPYLVTRTSHLPLHPAREKVYGQDRTETEDEGKAFAARHGSGDGNRVWVTEYVLVLADFSRRFGEGVEAVEEETLLD